MFRSGDWSGEAEPRAGARIGARSRSFSEGVRAAAPLVAGYVPAAVAFGVAAHEAGLGFAETMWMSFFVYSGASQFALVGLIAAGASWVAAALTGLALGLRHVLYGPSLARHLRGIGAWRTALVAYGLTDEVFAVASVKLASRRDPFRWMAALQSAVFLSWLGGTWIGASAGALVAEAVPSLAPALSFALPALFVALLAALILSEDRAASIPTIGAVAVAGALAATFHLAGLGNWGILAAGVAGPIAGTILHRRRIADAP